VHWDCWRCEVLGPNATSQKAEIIGAYSAALLVLDYITNTYANGDPIPEFVFRGDSSYVCNKFPSSEELSEHVIRTVRATNTSNKEEMLLLLDALTNINFKWRFEWVPRQYNAPADELANAVMDDRQPCRDIVAYEPQAAVTLQEDALRRLWDLARAKRVPLFHRLPFEAIPVWKQVCDLILSHEAFRISRLATLLLAPLALLQRNKDNIKQRLMRMVARPQLIIEAYYRAAQQDTDPEARRPRRDTSIEGAVERACALNPDKALGSRRFSRS
jgi:ribonuclease HI